MRKPDDTQRHAIYGMTGSGKTTFGLWCLSGRSYNKMPWIIVDFKRDPLIEQIPNLHEFGINEKLPKKRGIYVVRPEPADSDDGVVTAFFYKVWRQENTGLFIDENYMIKMHDRGYRAVLTQGRSKRIPVISLSQKPSWISPFVHSESEFKSVFYLQMPTDIDRVQDWLPPREPSGGKTDPSNLPPHHSYWYCVHTREFARFGPCPDEGEILEKFDQRRVRRHFI